IAYIEIGTPKIADVDINMELEFDSNNNGSLDVQESKNGNVDQYRNGSSHMTIINTVYFEIRWNPEALQHSEVSRDQDNCYIDIKVSTSNNDVCPDQHALYTWEDQHWCYTIYWPVPPAQGFTFEDASHVCESHGDVLPIMYSEEATQKLADLAYYHLGRGQYFWIGLVCNEDCDTWQWQDGSSFTAFDQYSDAVSNPCSGSKNRYAQSADRVTGTAETKQWYSVDPDHQFNFAVCGRRVLNSRTDYAPSVSPCVRSITELNLWTTDSIIDTTLSTDSITDSTGASPSIESTTLSIGSTTESNNQNSDLPLWLIISIIIGIIFILVCCLGIILMVRRQILSLRAKVVEEQIENNKEITRMQVTTKLNQQPYSHYSDLPGRIEWEIERTLVSIDYNQKIGE
ncbi:hypothetical protein PENTCL1PPCAC_20492, partial [Pristionchus entomophagus]